MLEDVHFIVRRKNNFFGVVVGDRGEMMGKLMVGLMQ
jgi:hypothetical protein